MHMQMSLLCEAFMTKARCIDSFSENWLIFTWHLVALTHAPLNSHSSRAERRVPELL